MLIKQPVASIGGPSADLPGVMGAMNQIGWPRKIQAVRSKRIFRVTTLYTLWQVWVTPAHVRGRRPRGILGLANDFCQATLGQIFGYRN